MTITLTREEAQQVLDALEGSIDAQQWEIDDHITKYGEWYRPKRVECMKQQLADTNKTIETLRARLAHREPEPVAWRTFDGEGGYDYRDYELNEDYGYWWEERHPNHKGWVQPLYIDPTPCQTCEALARTVMMDQTYHDNVTSQREITDDEFVAEAKRRGFFGFVPTKLWLWKNFVDGKPEYWAFDNPYPTNLEDGDPQTLGQPCGYAIFKPSRDGSNGRTEEQVLREMASVKSKPQLEPKPVAWLVENKQNPTRRYVYTAEQLQELGYGNISTEPFNILAPLYTAPPQRECKCKHCGGINVC